MIIGSRGRSIRWYLVNNNYWMYPSYPPLKITGVFSAPVRCWGWWCSSRCSSRVGTSGSPTRSSGTQSPRPRPDQSEISLWSVNSRSDGFKINQNLQLESDFFPHDRLRLASLSSSGISSFAPQYRDQRCFHVPLWETERSSPGWRQPSRSSTTWDQWSASDPELLESLVCRILITCLCKQWLLSGNHFPLYRKLDFIKLGDNPKITVEIIPVVSIDQMLHMVLS